jgi:hypothetical protein
MKTWGTQIIVREHHEQGGGRGGVGWPLSRRWHLPDKGPMPRHRFASYPISFYTHTHTALTPRSIYTRGGSESGEI